ncbi:MAG: class I SAM-dependent methyltransferase [Planctomycetota bacterium]|nr:class I SAM-dependent methyltransferase [Planctomycetota bacterium]
MSHSGGGVLPHWPAHAIAPTPGVCFVFVDDDNPLRRRLAESGGIEGEHYIVLEKLASSDSKTRHDRALSDFVSNLGSDHNVVTLGYGDQGKMMTRRLIDEFGLDMDRFVIIDHADASRHAAERDGFRLVSDLNNAGAIAGVLSTPLMRHGKLHSILIEALALGLPCFDNAIATRKTEFFETMNGLHVDAAAQRSLEWTGSIARARDLTPGGIATYRHDVRQIQGVEVAELHRGVSLQPFPANTPIDVRNEVNRRGLDPSTLVRNVTTYVTLHDRRALGVFAAREFCRSIWPEAVEEVFPSPHPLEMGTTDFERMLRRHVDGCEYITASQTSAQQAVLGIVARHYALESPIIEIGSALGGSALLMALATAEGAEALHSIDPDTATRDVMRFAFEREGQLDRLRQHVMTSEEAARCPGLLPEQAGLVFIDGLHTYDATLLDFELYADRVRPGGALLIHDVTIERYSVWRVFAENIVQDERFKAMTLVDGLVVMERRKDGSTHDGS